MKDAIPIFNTIAQARGGNTPGRPWFSVQAAADEHTILIHDQIGKDWWTDDGIASKEFALEFGKIPAGRKIKLRINSNGGSVHDGLAIHNIVAERRQDVTVVVDGVAASIASVIALAGHKTVMPKNALFMIHNPWSRVTGDEHAMRKAADMLRIHGDAIAQVYTDRTKKPKDEILAAMNAETWMTGETAIQWGFATDVTGDDVSAAISPEVLNAAPEAIRVAAQSTASRSRSASGDPANIMNRNQIIALLKKHGVQVDDNATDSALAALLETTLARASTAPAASANPQAAAQAPTQPAAQAPAAATDTTIVHMQAQLETLRRERDTERANRIGRDVDALIVNNQIPANSREDWVKRATADETVLNSLRALPQNLPGTSPAHSIRITAEDPTVIVGELANIRSRVAASDRFNPNVARERGMAFAMEYGRNRDRILTVLNTNTIDTGLKRQAIIQEVMMGFAKKLLPLRAFSSVFNAELEGTDKVNVPFVDLHSTASTDYNGSNGYVMGDSTNSSKEITINKRKYQALGVTSSEVRRQPFLLLAQQLEQRIATLGSNIFADVLSIVTAANYGAAAKVSAAAAFDAQDVADIKGACDTAEWPDVGRSLILVSTHDVALLKDTAVAAAMNYGGSEAIRQGRIPSLFGFDYFPCNNVPANSESLVGMASHRSCIVFAQAPIMPTEEVMQQLTAYEVFVDPVTGASFEYRRWGSADYDTTKQVVEANYGYALGNAAAIKRITSA